MRLITALALLCLFASVADARPRQPRQDSTMASQCIYDNTARIVCPGPAGRTTGAVRVRTAYEAVDVQIVGGRPAGCPHRYCGCAVSLEVFGRIVDGLNLAANWKHKFPRAAPAAGMVAARSGHVFLIQSMIDADTALAWDPNSGGGKTRIHARSLRGYTVVDPSGSRVASR